MLTFEADADILPVKKNCRIFMEIVALKIPTPVSRPVVDRLRLLLSHDEQHHVAQIIDPVNSARQLVATSFLRTVLCDRLQIPTKCLSIHKGAFGKPFIDAHHDLRFNMSHSGEYVVCAMDTAEIGVDMEKIKVRECQAISAFFSPRELSVYNGKAFSEKSGFFFELWTAKESFIKALGYGFALDLADFTINFGRSITVETTIDPRHWHFRQFEIDPDYKMTVCALHADFPHSVRMMHFAQLVSSAEQLIA
jgi:4'-phosphopantetheinyl transferase